MSGADPSKNEEEGRGTVIAALIGNAAIAATKFFAAATTGSSAMLAEGFHSVVDTGNQACMLYGMKKAKKPADEHHPFGYGKEVFFWAFVVAILLFSLGAGLSIYEGIRAFLHGEGHHEGFPWASVIVLLVAAAFEGYAVSVALKEFEKARKGSGLLKDARAVWPLWKDFQQLKNPSIFVVMCEDFAALAGISVALVGVLLTWIFQTPFFDATASILIGVILGITAGVLAYEVKQLLIGEAASDEVKKTVRAILDSYDEITAINEVRSMHLGPNDILVAVSLDFEGDTRARRIETIVTDAERRIRDSVPSIGQIFLEVQDREDHLELADPDEKAVGTT